MCINPNFTVDLELSEEPTGTAGPAGCFLVATHVLPGSLPTEKEEVASAFKS